MGFDISKNEAKLLFVPLGGVDKIGMNFYAYHFNGKWLVVDMGLGFAEASIPGVDIILPLPVFLERYKDDIVGLILTHAHEDHIGAIPFLWDNLQCKIYTSPLTAEILKTKLAEFDMDLDVPLFEVQSDKTLDLSPFKLDFVGITHSIPEMRGIFIHTKVGTIFHTGDWKFDPEPLVGEATDKKKLAALAKKGVLAMVSDSTNIFSEGRSGSESELAKSLKKLIGDCKEGLVVVTTFASNISRVYSIAKAAEACGKKVVLAGHSLWRLHKAASECGYLKDLPEVLSTNEIRNYDKKDVLVICTGCQGEVFAVTSKLIRGEHPDFELTRGDTIIFSSKIIPGNEKKIFALFNGFCTMGVEVMTERDHFVHVSGHPAREEVKEMCELIKPKIVIPIHGEIMHLHEHCKFVRSLGIKYAIESKVGDVIHIKDGGPEKIGEVETGVLVVDGNVIMDKNSSIINERIIMSENGFVFVVIVTNKGGSILRQPKIFAPGLLDKRRDNELIDLIIEGVRDNFGASNANRMHNFVDKRPKKKGSDYYDRKRSMENLVRSLMRKYRRKNPYVIVHIEQV